MAEYEEDDFMSAVEIPCEFCGLLWPIEIYIEHETGCRPDLTSSTNFADYDFEYNTAVPERSAFQVLDDAIAPKVEKLLVSQVSSNQKKSATDSVAKETINEVKQNISAPIPPVTVKSSYEPKKEIVQIQTRNSPTESGENKPDSTVPDIRGNSNEPKKIFQKHGIQNQKKDILNEMKGETLLSFGNVADTSKFSENETQDEEGQDEAKDIEDINNLSDDECEETLEEFWKRARDFLNRQRLNKRS